MGTVTAKIVTDEIDEYLKYTSKDQYTTIVKILKKSLSYLSRKGGWIQGTNARDKNGKAVLAFSPDACCFCSAGAIIRSSREVNIEETNCVGDWVVSGILKSVIFQRDDESRYGTYSDKKDSGTPTIIHWNDLMVKKKSQVLAAFKDTIKVMEERFGK